MQSSRSANPDQDLDEEIHAKLGGLLANGATDWIYFNDIEKTWEQYLDAHSVTQDVSNNIFVGDAAAASAIAA